MIYMLAKALEVSGLVTLLWALYIGMTGKGMFVEVAMLAAGAVAFYTGRALEKRAGHRSGGPGGPGSPGGPGGSGGPRGPGRG